MNGTELIRARRSVRRFKAGEPVQPEHLHLMLEAAMMAPSAQNLRPWEFLVVTNRELMEAITEVSPYTQMLKTASAAIVVCGLPKVQEGRCGAFWPEDCGAAIENLLLCALELGYGTCWCGLYPSDEGRYEAMAKLIGTDEGVIPMAVIAVGVADEEPAQRGYYDESRVKILD